MAKGKKIFVVKKTFINEFREEFKTADIGLYCVAGEDLVLELRPTKLPQISMPWFLTKHARSVESMRLWTCLA